MRQFYIFTFLLCSIFAKGQETAVTENGEVVQLFKNGTYKRIKTAKASNEYLTVKDFQTKGDSVIVPTRKISIKRADESFAQVTFKFSCEKKDFSSDKIKLINNMIANANSDVMNQMKNKYTYQPRKINMFYSNGNERWSMYFDYTSENDYGGLKDRVALVRYTSDFVFYDIEFY